jgi:hypothetical protein
MTAVPSSADLEVDTPAPGRTASPLGHSFPSRFQTEGDADSPTLPGRLRQLQMGNDPTDRTSPQGTMLLERKMQRQMDRLVHEHDQDLPVSSATRGATRRREQGQESGFARGGTRPVPSPLDIIEDDTPEPGTTGFPLGRSVPARFQAEGDGGSPMLPGRLHQLQMGNDPTERSSPQGTMLLQRKMQRQAEDCEEMRDRKVIRSDQPDGSVSSLSRRSAARRREEGQEPGFARSGVRPVLSQLDVGDDAPEPEKTGSPLGRSVPARFRAEGDVGSPMLPGRLHQLQMGNDPTERSSPQGTMLLGRKMERQRQGHEEPHRPMLRSDQAVPEDSTSSPVGAALLARRIEQQNGMGRAWPVSGAQNGGTTAKLQTGALTTPPKPAR